MQMILMIVVMIVVMVIIMGIIMMVIMMRKIQLDKEDDSDGVHNGEEQENE